MPSPPYAKALASINGGPAQSGLVTLNAGDLVALTPESTVGWVGSPRWELFDYPVGFTTPSGWSLDTDTNYIVSTSIVPTSFTWPVYSSTTWGKISVRLRINLTSFVAAYIDQGLILNVLSNQGVEGLAAGEATQGDKLRSWPGTVMRALRTLNGVLMGAFPTPLLALLANKSSFGNGSAVPLDFDLETVQLTDGTTEKLVCSIAQPDHSSGDYVGTMIVRNNANNNTWRGDIIATFESGTTTPVVTDSLPGVQNVRASGALKSGTQPQLRLGAASNKTINLYAIGVAATTLDGSATLQGQKIISVAALGPTPTITSVSPTHIAAVGGSINITGTNFISSTVTCGGAAVTGLTVTSTLITGTVHGHVVGSAPIVVTNLDGQTATIAFTYDAPTAPAPTITSVSPTHGTAGGGTALTLVCTNLFNTPDTIKISIGGTPATSVAYVSPTSATCTSPLHAAGATTLVLTNPDAQTASVAYTFDAGYDPPTDFGANLSHWSRGDSYTNSAGRVSAITDKTSNGNTWTQITAGQGPYTANADGNGHASVRCGLTQAPSAAPAWYGSGTVPLTSAVIGAAATSWQMILAIIIHGANANDATNAYLGDGVVGDTSGYWGLACHNRGGGGNVTLVGYVYHSGEKKTPDVVVPVNTRIIVRLRMTGNTLYLQYNGTEVSVGTVGSIDAGGNSVTTTFCHGYNNTHVGETEFLETVIVKSDGTASTASNGTITGMQSAYNAT